MRVCNLSGWRYGFPLTSLFALSMHPLAQGPAVKLSSYPRKPFGHFGLAVVLAPGEPGPALPISTS